MLKLIYFENYQEVLQYDFPLNIKVICPSPKITDSFRQATKSRYEVFTIANWVSQSFGDRIKVGKSELMLRFSSAWRNYFPDSSELLFYNAFELFTELRSFSLDLGVIQNLIEGLDTELQKSILIFWAVLDAEKLIDEHLAYELKKNDKLQNQSLLFFGFKHLSAIQIDLLKHLANFNEVFLFFPKEVKEKAISSDWINWLDTSEVKFIPSNAKSKLKIINYSSGKLNSYLIQYAKQKESASICLLGNEDYLATQEVLIDEIFFKDKVDIFRIEFNQIFSHLKKQKLSTTTDLIAFCHGEIKKSIEIQNFKMIKVYQLINESLELYSMYSNNLDSFAIGLIKQVVELNLPRNFLIPILPNPESFILNLDDLKFVSKDQKIILVMSKNASPFARNESSYNSLLVDKLKVIGPMKRGSLDIALNMFELRHLFNTSEVHLFLEDGMMETDAGVREICKGFEIEFLDLSPNFSPKVLQDIIIEDIKSTASIVRKNSTSASRLQTYYDCPRKYYANYVAKLDVKLDSRSGLGSDDKGILEHLIIGKYFKSHQQITSFDLEELCRNELDNYIKNKQMLLSKKQFNETLYELVEYTANGLIYLYDLQKRNINTEILFEFELPANQYNLIGSIDCLINEEGNIKIIDFKRSDAAIGSKQGLLDFEKLQLWLYGLAISEKFNVSKIGYLNISEANALLEVDFTIGKENFIEVFLKVESSFKNDMVFKPNPRNPNVCEFCTLKYVCPKGSINE